MANEQISEITTVPTNATVIKIINALIKRYNSLGSIYTFKGSVQTYDDLLAIQNPNVGDVYNVVQEDEEHQIAAGSNFVWDGTVWDNLGGSLDGLVQSVNGINPDSLGNVLLPLIKNVTTHQGVLTITKNDDSTEQFNNIKKLYMLPLGENIDLNDLTESGVYICKTNSYAENYENCPIQKAFLLEVQALNDGVSNFVYQFLTQYNDGSTEAGNQYIRTYYNENWSAWRMAGSGSNLTTYTSLEQIGITPGQETFAAIHNALPINSVLCYYVTPNNFNNSIYPNESYGYVYCSKTSDTTSTNFIFSCQNASELDVYTRYFNSGYAQDEREWSLLAKQSDLTNLSNSVVKSVNGIKPINGNVDITGIPVGTILPFAGSTIPSGFLACNGAAVSRTTYSALFAAIGTTYGSGNGSSTFNLPNAESDKFLQGNSKPGTVKAAGLPNITGNFVVNTSGKNGAISGASATGAFSISNNQGRQRWNAADDGGDAPKGFTATFSAQSSNSVYGKSATVQPPALTVRFIIKY